MAVTPVGNPYVESSDLVANYVGTSEALAERLDVVGVNPFADSAARATAIPSPVEGQMASLNDDDKVYRYNGSAWVAVGAAGMAFIGAFTATAASSIVANNVFTSTFSVYRMFAVITTAANDTNIALRLRVGGADASGSDYRFNAIAAQGSPSSSSSVNTSFTQTGIDNDNANVLAVTLIDPQAASATGYIHDHLVGYPSAQQVRASGIHTLSTAYDGFNLYSPSNFTTTLYLYGMVAA
jgi:hypothetical protein